MAKVKHGNVLKVVAKEMKMSVKRLDDTIGCLFKHMTIEGYKDLLRLRAEAQLDEPRDINESSPIMNKGVGTFYLRSRKGAAEKKGEFADNFLGEKEGYETFRLVLNDNKGATDAIIAQVDAEREAANAAKV